MPKKIRTKGRSKLQITENEWTQIEKLASIFCTGEEIASVIGISYDTLERQVKEVHQMPCADYIKKHQGSGKASLRRAQFKSAMAGNNAMLIWLGKQYLGQKDSTAIDVDDNVQIKVINNKGKAKSGNKS